MTALTHSVSHRGVKNNRAFGPCCEPVQSPMRSFVFVIIGSLMKCPCLCLRSWRVAMPILGAIFCRGRQLNERVDCSGIPEKWEGKVLKLVSNKVGSFHTTTTTSSLHLDLAVALTEVDVTQNPSACIGPGLIECPPYV